MPFVSKAQERWAFGTHQKFAERWAKMADEKKLPLHVKKTRKSRKK